MKKVGCLTFHGAYNYGSALQAYALQESVINISKDIDYKIINYRTQIQSISYQSVFQKKDLKSIYSRFFVLGKTKELEGKSRKFEKFLLNELRLTNRVESIDEAYRIIDQFDTIIVGSDQVWNIRAFDFSWLYFLEQKKSRINAFSYAVSMGCKKIECTQEESQRIKNALKSFNHVSVRDCFTKEFLTTCGYSDNQISINCDPVLLMDAESWKKLANSSECILPRKKYILFYDLSRNKENWKIAKEISKMMNMPVIITCVPFPRTISESCSSCFEKYFNVGPKEWLKLIMESELVLSSSFHGTVFSVLFKKKFYTINGASDYRISTFLRNISLEDRDINVQNYREKVDINVEIDYSKANDYIAGERLKSAEYLRRILTDC